MTWETPVAEDIQCGMEVTAYVAAIEQAPPPVEEAPENER